MSTFSKDRTRWFVIRNGGRAAILSQVGRGDAPIAGTEDFIQRTCKAWLEEVDNPNYVPAGRIRLGD